MIVNGREIAATIINTLRNEVSHLNHQPHLTVITCDPKLATKRYIKLKKRSALEAGIQVTVIELPPNSTTEDCVAVVERSAWQSDGVIVQLPLPAQIDSNRVLAAIPKAVDVDGVHYTETGAGYIPPVVGAISLIAKHYDVLFAGRKAVVVGHGRLVGQPAELWAKNQGAQVAVLSLDSADNQQAIKEADILILGAGVPGLILPEAIKPGAVIFDAGTAEDGGKLKGDADSACAAVASLFTPVPGGIGPVTVAVLLHNVFTATQAVAKP